MAEVKQRIVGILALQGDFDAHRRLLEDRLSTRTIRVKTPADLQLADALIIPGGESTTMMFLLDRIGLVQAIRERSRAGMPVYGTCAGMILMSKEIEGRTDQHTLDLMDITVRRNAFGRQVDSFEAELDFSSLGSNDTVRGVFIRAPYVSRSGPTVEVNATFDGHTVSVRQRNLLATAFHPELTDSIAVHSLFVSMVNDSRENR